MKDKYEILEFNLIKEKVNNYARTSMGKVLVNNLSMLDNIIDVKDALNETDEALKIIYAYGPLPLHGIFDITSDIEKVKKDYILEIENIYRISRNIEITREVLKFKEELPLKDCLIFNDYIDQIHYFEYVKKKIDDCISPSLDIYDHASSELKRIRKEIKRYESEIKSKVDHFIVSNSDYLNDSLVTYRNDRLVVPVKDSYKYQIKGIIHDESQSRQTSYVEPDFVIELNSKIYKLKQDEHEEIMKILKYLCSLIKEVGDALIINQKMFTKLDFMFAKGMYAKEINGQIPVLKEGKTFINFVHARHPLLDKKTVVANDISLGLDKDIIIVSGPNAGGKTVYLKTIGLLCLMALSGLAVSVDGKCEMTYLSDIFLDIGDEQSISQSLSTFSSHMSKLINIIDNIDDNSLVLLDEIGGGTDPKEGEALAMAIIDYLHQRKTLGVITTHYSNLKTFAIEKEYINNASMLFDEETLTPLYKIIIGLSGNSYAYDISLKLGLDKFILDNAKKYEEYYSKEQDKLIEKLENELKELKKREEKLLLEIENNKVLQKEMEAKNLEITKKLEEINESAQDQIDEKIIEALESIDTIVNDLKKNENLKMNEWIDAKKKVKEFHKEKKEEIIENHDELNVGDNVLVTSINKMGKITRINNGKYMVNVNGISLTLDKNKLQYVSSQKEEIKPSKVKIGSGLKTVNYELNIIGLTVEEAMPKVIKHLDDARVVHLKQIRIIHGFGTGALRNAVHEYLKKQKNIEYRFGGPGEGGQGATIVSIK